MQETVFFFKSLAYCGNLCYIFEEILFQLPRLIPPRRAIPERTGMLWDSGELLRLKTKDEVYQIDLMRIVGALWHRAWAIVLAALICGAMGFGYARFFITPLYQSSVLLYVNSSTISVGSTAISMSDLNLSKSLVDTYLVILKTRLTLNEVIARANLPYSYGTLNGMISGAAVNDTEIFRVTVTGPNAEETAVIANIIGEVLPDKVSEIIDGTSVRIVDYAVVPGGKSSPNISRYTTMGVFAGVAISVALICLLEFFDEQIRSEEFLTEKYGYSVLAVVPDLNGSKEGKGYGGHRSYYYGAYRTKKDAVQSDSGAAQQEEPGGSKR